MIKPECQPTLCFLYSPVDSEIIHVNNDSCRSPSFPSACLPFSSFLSIPPSLPPRLSPSYSLSSPALYHSVPVTVTVRAFGAPRRHSHVAAADMRMWPWLAAPWRATREHLKGCLTAGWEILGSPRGPRTSSFRRKLYAQTQNTRALEQGHEISCSAEPQLRGAGHAHSWHMTTQNPLIMTTCEKTVSNIDRFWRNIRLKRFFMMTLSLLCLPLLHDTDTHIYLFVYFHKPLTCSLNNVDDVEYDTKFILAHWYWY